MNPADPEDRRRHAEAVARARLRSEAMDHGCTLPEAEAYADAMLPTTYGRGLVLDYHLTVLRQELTGRVEHLLLPVLAWLTRRARR